jgi:hypothetical protein
MKQFPLWPLVVVFGVNWALIIIAKFGVKWSFWRNRKKWETDEQLLSRYKEIRKDVESRGKSFDLEHELAAAIVRRDWSKLKEGLELQNSWAAFIQWASQLVLIGFAGKAYVDDDANLFILLALFLLWRSVAYRFDQNQQLHELIMTRLHWMAPTAESDFFKSEHCYDFGKDHRAWELLRKDGYFDAKSPPPPMQRP